VFGNIANLLFKIEHLEKKKPWLEFEQQREIATQAQKDMDLATKAFKSYQNERRGPLLQDIKYICLAVQVLFWLQRERGKAKRNRKAETSKSKLSERIGQGEEERSRSFGKICRWGGDCPELCLGTRGRRNQGRTEKSPR
jgi:hypothetical protein